MKEMPRVTVLMPVYNERVYLDTAIESILGQSFKEFELLIVDDGSDTPVARSIDRWALRDSRIRVLRNAKNTGVTAALNRGLAAAKGELLARQDADDISLPRRLQLQVEYFERNPRHVLLGCDCALIDGRGRITAIDSTGWADFELRFISMVRTPIVHSSAMFRMGPVRAHRLAYDENYLSAEDFDLWVRMQAFGELAVIPEVLVHYRLHAAAISSRRQTEQHQNMRDIALASSLQYLPELNAQRAQLEAFLGLLYLRVPQTAESIGMACEGAEAIAGEFGRVCALTATQQFRVRRLCARWLAMGLWRSRSWLRPLSMSPLLRRAPSLAGPLLAELADFSKRRIRGRTLGS